MIQGCRSERQSIEVGAGQVSAGQIGAGTNEEAPRQYLPVTRKPCQPRCNRQTRLGAGQRCALEIRKADVGSGEVRASEIYPVKSALKDSTLEIYSWPHERSALKRVRIRQDRVHLCSNPDSSHAVEACPGEVGSGEVRTRQVGTRKVRTPDRSTGSGIPERSTSGPTR